jgi:hypothetical protein
VCVGIPWASSSTVVLGGEEGGEEGELDGGDDVEVDGGEDVEVGPATTMDGAAVMGAVTGEGVIGTQSIRSPAL